MGSRGGRGRGRFGGGGFRFAKQEPFVLFPSDIELPAIDEDKIEKNKELVKLRNNLQRGLKNLPYFMEDTFAYEEEETVDIERYSDTKKRGRTDQISLENSGFLTLLPGYFPLELVKGTKRRTGRKVIWTQKRDKKLDHLELLEGKFKDEDGKKKNEGEEEEEEEVEEEEELEDSDNDYMENEVFDDDDDDYNQAEDDDDDFIL
ncbi:uncharacterized protein LOC141646609 isoform X2 [Silene latifolia]|uniref:uncharacterized protein LOC141646609 isoform X2 n=1 Tax=Silene latifolia TaxID=37657 RepID=UPI003D789555